MELIPYNWYNTMPHHTIPYHAIQTLAPIRCPPPPRFMLVFLKFVLTRPDNRYVFWKTIKYKCITYLVNLYSNIFFHCWSNTFPYTYSRFKIHICYILYTYKSFVQNRRYFDRQVPFWAGFFGADFSIDWAAISRSWYESHTREWVSVCKNRINITQH